MSSPWHEPCYLNQAMKPNYIELAKRQPQYCAIQRNAIAHHRNQIRFVSDLYRQNKGAWNLRIIKSHSDEIRAIYSQLDVEAARYA